MFCFFNIKKTSAVLVLDKIIAPQRYVCKENPFAEKAFVSTVFDIILKAFWLSVPKVWDILSGFANSFL